MSRPARPHDIRIAEYISIAENGCWLWTGPQNGYGYGAFCVGSKVDKSIRKLMAHRVVYERERGPIPDGLQLDHLCRNRICVNPDHLEPVTQRENLLRGETIPALNAAKTHCAHGHAYDVANTGRDKQTNARICRTCRRQQQQEIRDRRKAAK